MGVYLRDEGLDGLLLLGPQRGVEQAHHVSEGVAAPLALHPCHHVRLARVVERLDVALHVHLWPQGFRGMPRESRESRVERDGIRDIQRESS